MIKTHAYSNFNKTFTIRIQNIASPKESNGMAIFFALTIMLLASMPSFAEDNHKMSVGVGFTAGGDTLKSAQLVNPETGDTTDESVTTGGELHFWVGGLFPISSSVYSLVALGYYFDDITASDGKVTFKRRTLDAPLYYQIDNTRLGAGLTYHFNVEYYESGVPGNRTVKFENSLGFIISAIFPLGQRSFIELRRTLIDYTASSINGSAILEGRNFDGNSWGLYISTNY